MAIISEVSVALTHLFMDMGYPVLYDFSSVNDLVSDRVAYIRKVVCVAVY